ncbi:MAG: outer membrane protein assembly factor BamD [Candidatus Aureabacteria bacterium]|nr:outer membrane protein assembly factor BamD [Candidatus Auribacterota bacterium]
MKIKYIKIHLIILLLFALFSSHALIADEPFKRGKLVFNTPPDIEGLSAEEVMEKAARLEDKGDLNQSLEVLKSYKKNDPDNKYVPEITFRIGKLLVKMNKYSKAYQTFQKIFEKHSNLSNPDRVLEKLYEIAEAFYEGKKRKVLGIPLAKQYNKAIKIYEQVISHAPFGKYADASQFKIGKTYLLLHKEDEAIKTFRVLLKEYPESIYAEEALFLIAKNNDLTSNKSDYDQKKTEKAIETYRKFLKLYPESTYYEEAKQRLNVLLNKKGKEIFMIAKFYFDRGKYKAAKIYFDSLIENYATTEWAEKSTQYLSRIELKENENENHSS